MQPPDAVASSCCRLPDWGELAEAAAVVGVGAEEVAATDEGGGGGEASGSAVTNGFSGVMASNGEITQLATMVGAVAALVSTEAGMEILCGSVEIKQMALLVSLLCGATLSSEDRVRRIFHKSVGGGEAGRSGRSRSQFVRGLTCNWAAGSALSPLGRKTVSGREMCAGGMEVGGDAP